MTTKKIYGPWIKWHGGECPVPPDTIVEGRLRGGTVGEAPAGDYYWLRAGDDADIVKYRTVTVRHDLDAAEKLLLANGYIVTLPARPLTFEDVVPMTEAPPEGTAFWVVSATTEEGVYRTWVDGDKFASRHIKRRMAYFEKEHALIAAHHIFGLKGGEL